MAVVGGGGGGKTTRTMKFDDGSVQFRQRLACSLLSHRPLLLRNIRADDLDEPGLREHEASYLRLLDEMTNGTVVEINETGTQLRFKPGVLLGGDVDHDCPSGEGGRAVGWYLEGLLPLAPFGKEPLNLTLTGITDGTSRTDPSPEYLTASSMPLLKRFGIGTDDEDDGVGDGGPPLALSVERRGAHPWGGGAVTFSCPSIREISSPLDFTDVGKFKRVRGTAVSCRISPSSVARVAHSAKGLLHRLLPDVWIHTDARSAGGGKRDGGGCGPSPGLGLTLSAESATGVILSAECCLDAARGGRSELPEDLGTRGAALLLDEVRKGGCVDTTGQSTALLLMCLGPEDVARVRLGTLSRYTIESLRLFRDAFGVEFKVKADERSKTVLLSCLGIGYRNMARAST